MKFSAERIAFYEGVRTYHQEAGLDPRFHRSALEGYFKSLGGNPWTLTDDDHQQYAEWRKGQVKAFTIPK